jgi:hypothetical protein
MIVAVGLTGQNSRVSSACKAGRTETDKLISARWDSNKGGYDGVEDNTLEIAYRRTTGTEGAPLCEHRRCSEAEEVGELWRSRKRARTEDRA